MPDENKILIALGLDTSQFESGTGRAASNVTKLSQALNSVDKELRSIPIVGDLYAISFGKIIDGFSQIKEEGREFSRIMRTDVAGGLDETMTKIEDATNLLAKLKVGSFGRSIADFFKDAKNSNGRSILEMTQPGGQQFAGEAVKRETKVKELEAERKKLLEGLLAAHEQDARARSEAYSKSILITDQAKIESEYAKELGRAQEEATKFGGPDREKWSKQVIENLEKEKQLAEGIRDAELQAADRRAASRSLENSASVAASYESAAGNARTAAEQNLRTAKERYTIEKEGTAEQEQAAAAAVTVAENQLHAAQIEYEFSKRQLDIETELVDLQVRGQTRAANQAKIRADYETRIANEERRGNKELADSLRLQQKSALLAEEIRQYELGGGGRAKERQEERRKAQVARIAQNRLDQRSKDEKGLSGLSSGGLVSGGLRSGGLGHGLPAKLKDKTDNRSKQDKFMDKITEQMGKIVSELGT